MHRFAPVWKVFLAVFGVFLSSQLFAPKAQAAVDWCDANTKTCHCAAASSRGSDINACLATVKGFTQSLGGRWTLLLPGHGYSIANAADQIVIDFPVIMKSETGEGRCGTLDRNNKVETFDFTCAHFVAAPGFKNNTFDKNGLITVTNTNDVDLKRLIINGNYGQRKGLENCNIYDAFGMTACANVAFIKCRNCILEHSAIVNGVNDKTANHYGYMSIFVDTPGMIVYNNLFARAGLTSYSPNPPYDALLGQRQNCFEMVAYDWDVNAINVAANEVFECGDGGLVFSLRNTRRMTGNVQSNSVFLKSFINISHQILVYAQNNTVNPWVDLGGPWNSSDPNQVLMIHHNAIDCAWGKTGTARDGKKGCPVGISIGGRGWKQNMWMLGSRVFSNSIANARIGIDINQGGMKGSILGDRYTQVTDNCMTGNSPVKINYNPMGISDIVANPIKGNCQSGAQKAYENVAVPTFTARDTWGCSWGYIAGGDCTYKQFPVP